MADVTLDTSTDRGRHVAARLRNDIVAWLSTVRPSGQPDTVPVWFLWDGDTVLIYSQPNQVKLRNIAGNPHVALALDDTKGGGDVIRIEGAAAVDESHPSCDNVPAYVAKYEQHIIDLGYTVAEFAEAYSVAVVITPTRYRT
ncbi:MAG TPA: TIGR03667 family PPOX class F420-dependent oxidoreductase [Thermomicrobiales bacterium]|nr:TIGR03667 family PPOX class F420-dependent oxidoreductase [Thermomicrobiales bacterium]